MKRAPARLSFFTASNCKGFTLADIRILELPLATGPTAPAPSDVVAIDGTTTRRTPISAMADAIRPVASQAEAEAGVNTTKVMSSVNVKQSISSQIGVTLASSAQGLLASSAMQPSVYDSASKGFNVYAQSFRDDSPRYYGAIGNGIANDTTSYQSAEASLPVIFIPNGNTFNLPSVVPSKPVSGNGSLKLGANTFSGFSAQYDLVKSSLIFAPTSYADVVGIPSGSALNFIYSLGANIPSTGVRRVTAYGTQNLVAAQDLDRVEIFGNLTGQWTQKAERLTSLGTIAGQFFGAYEANVKTYHNFWSTEYTAVPPGDPAWNVGGLETLSPGIGAAIAAFTDYASPSSDRANTGRAVFTGRNAANLTVNGRDLVLDGYRAGSCLYSAFGTTAQGSDALKNAVFHDEATVQGFEAGRDWVLGNRNNIKGRGAAYQATSGVRNVIDGSFAAADHKTLNRNVILGFRAANGIFSSGTDVLEDAFVVANDQLSNRKPLLLGNMATGAFALNASGWSDLGGLFRVFDFGTNTRYFGLDTTGIQIGRTSYSSGTAGTGVNIAHSGDLTSFRAGTGVQAHFAFFNNAAVTPARIGDIATTGSQLQIRDSAGNARFGVTTTGIGFFGVTPVNRQTLNAAATDAATTQTLVNQIRTFLINTGIMQ